MAIFRGTGGSGDASTNVSINQVTEKALEAEASATAAASSASDAASSASDASTSEANAASSATDAQTAQTAAEAAQTNAEIAETNAETAETNAEAAQTAAETAETNAETAETNAETAQAAAEDAQGYAEEWATKAEDSLVSTAAGGDGSTDYSALHHAAKASASATAASNAQTGAETAQGLAEDAQTAAETAQANAETAETNAETAQTAAESAQTAAETARDSALTALDSFDDRYLGVKSSDPTLDNDGNALVSGALYFNSVDNAMKVYDGSQWLEAYASGEDFLAKANNLSDLTSASTARTNLGLGTAATLDVGTSANNIVQLNGSGALPAVDGSNLTNVSSVANLNDLTDVDTTGVTDGQVIAYNATASEWQAADQSSAAGTFTTYKYTATSSQTVFTGADDDTNSLSIDNTDSIIVTLNGITLENGADYTATSSAVTLTTGATTDDELNIYAFNTFDVADYTQFPFFKSSGTAANIDLTGFNSVRFFQADGSASNIALG